MIDRPVKIGCTELYTARVLNMSVAQYYGVFKEYAELLNKARQRNSRKLKIKDTNKTELKIIYSIRKDLNKLVLKRINENYYENK
jgi:hypothetical protein